MSKGAKNVSSASNAPGREDVAGVILAGGLARRMGGRDKAFIELAGRPLVSFAIERLAPQVGWLALNANGEAARFAPFGLPVIADTVEGFAGPLAGILAAMLWAQDHAPEVSWIVSAATDTPFFPRDLVARFLDAVDREGARLACAVSNGRAQPVFGLWPVDLAQDLERALVDEDLRKIDRFTARYPLAMVDFSRAGCDPFFNINRPEDLRKAGGLTDACG